MIEMIIFHLATGVILCGLFGAVTLNIIERVLREMEDKNGRR